MPRRKQGQTKETTGGSQKKKTDTGTELIHNEAPKSLPIKNDLVFKIKKTLSSTTFSSTPNGKAEREHLEAAKSLNEMTMVSQHEVNNNLIKFSKDQECETAENGNSNSGEVHFKNSKQSFENSSDNVVISTDCLLDIKSADSSVKNGSSLRMPKAPISLNGKSKNSVRVPEMSLNDTSQNSVATSNKESRDYKFSKSVSIPIMSDASVKLALCVNSVESSESQMIRAKATKIRVEDLDGLLESQTEKLDVDRGSQMSGVSPACASIRNNSESHKLNYRISTSVTETRPNPLNAPVLKDEQNCELPSSVYGTPASSIENVLTGLHVSENVKDNIPGINKISFLQEILEQDARERKPYISEQITEVGKNNFMCKGRTLQESNKVFLNQKLTVLDNNIKNTSVNIFNHKDLNFDKTPQPKLKLHIPDSLSTDDSNSSLLSAESQKALKFPRITSPQILEQHISKIISENAAIVDTVDPLWPRRYLKPTSSSQSVESDIKRQGSSIKLLRTFEEKSMQSNTLDSSNHSKLQSALLGGSENEMQSSIQNLIISPISSSLSKARPFSQFSNISSSISTHSKTVNSVSEEELQGSAIKSLLSLKQGRYSKHKNAFCFDNKDMYNQHPQNPEGSIIKDLLLKTKSKDGQKLSPDYDVKTQPIFNASNFIVESSKHSDKVDVFQHKCPHCSTEFSDKYNLDTHISFCKYTRTSLFCLGDSSKKATSMPKTNAQTKSHVSEYQQNNFSTSVSDDSVQGIFRSESADDGSGPILKKQLLLPLARSPPIKRRKISEPVMMSNHVIEHQMDDKDSPKNIPNKTSFDGIAISPHRCRSQSVHLFGGEVQILDGANTKKMKIKTSIHGAFSSSTNMFSDNYPFQKSPNRDPEKDSNSLPPVVVTIAQPVHNSGGTVTHVPTRRTSSNLSPVVTLSNNIISEGLSKYGKFDLSSNDYYRNAPRIETLKNPSNEQSKKETSTENFSFAPFSFFPGPDSKCLQSSSSFHSSSFYNSSSLKDFKIASSADEASPMSFKLALSPDHGKPFYSPIFVGADKNAFDQMISESSTLNTSKENFLKIQNNVVPTVMFTPSSPTLPPTDNEGVHFSTSTSEPVKKFLAPTRPTSLPLKKKPFTMVGSTLISPETPRPKKSCIQLYLNGHAYTYLGLKCSTRSTYCCIYRPQPMFVLQETNPKLSMYSNWQIVPAKEELSGLTPGQMISLYSSKQNSNSQSNTTTAKLGEPLTFTHSSYWTYRSQEYDNTDCHENSNLHIHSANEQVAVKDSQCSVEQSQDDPSIPSTISPPLQRHETVISAPINKSEGPAHSADDSNHRLDTDNTLSDGDVNASNDDDDDDEDDECQDDGTESLTDSSQPQPPKRVKIFEGGFKSNEDYTYVRGRGRGKYVCEECGIRCKKPSMLKKHIRTHTDLRPYKCRHCSFAFKTKGNLTKHMKSKAHHKKCTELGIVPVPTTTDDSQIDEEALAKQIEKKKTQFSDGEDADDDEEDDSDESDDECESDTSMMTSNQKPKTLTNGHSKKFGSHEKLSNDVVEENTREKCDPISQHTVEQEAARSLLHLSALGEPSQWSTSTGDLTDVASSCETETGSLISTRHDRALLSPSQYASPSVPTIGLPSMNTKTVTDQSTLSWIPSETLGHRPRSYSADIPLGGGKEHLARYRLAKSTAVEAADNTPIDDTEFGGREQYARRYSISVAREARKPRILQPPEWGTVGFHGSASHKWPDLDTSDQPMDLSISRDLGKHRDVYGCGLSSTSLMTVVTQEETGLDTNLPINLETCLSEPYPLKSLPVLSPQVLTEYEAVGENSNSDATLLPSSEQSTFGTSSATRSIFYMPDISMAEGSIGRKETDVPDDPPSPDISDYAVCSPVSPPALDENTYYYGQDSLGQTAATPDEMPPASRFHAEFIVPSTSSGMEEGKCVCRICNKIFAKSSHLRLHVNIHYFERPFRCDNCAVSFRTKGHLQKHKRSVSHYNKVNMNLTFGTPTVDNPRPFKCADCKIAFRIHGHLAKHLRSKMHIMKLECLGKLPFGMYAEMERSGVSLNEIDTTDCNNSLESLQIMAQKLYQRDPRRMRWQGTEQTATEVDHAKSTTPVIDPALPITEPLAVAFNLPCTVIGLPVQSVAAGKPATDTGEVKQEPSETEALRNPSGFSDREEDISPLSRYLVSQPAPTLSQETVRRPEGTESDSGISLNRSGTCHLCGRLFKSAKFLQVHLYCDHQVWNPSSVNDITPSNNSPPKVVVSQDLICDLCGRHFPNQKVLQQHLLTHAQPRPFVCEVCDAGFTSSALLIAHQATHQISSPTSAASETRLVQLQ